MAKSVNTKATVVHAVALPIALENIAAQVAGALQETASLSETLGTLTRDAGKIIKKQPDMIDPFMDACRQLCASVGLTEGSFKVYMSNIRGVIRAMVEGYNPKDGQSLRAMYDAAPKGTGRQKATGARPNDGVKAVKGGNVESDDDDAIEAPPAAKEPSKADKRRAAMLELFGHVDDELEAAIAWAAAHELRFVNIVKSQIAFDAKPAKSVPVKKAA
jgi:hypothetical protein